MHFAESVALFVVLLYVCIPLYTALLESVCGVCACVCVCVGSLVFASTALVVVWTAMCLTSCSDCLTGFHEPLSPAYICHTRLKTVQHDHCTCPYVSTVYHLPE